MTVLVFRSTAGNIVAATSLTFHLTLFKMDAPYTRIIYLLSFGALELEKNESRCFFSEILRVRQQCFEGWRTGYDWIQVFLDLHDKTMNIVVYLEYERAYDAHSWPV